jgi:6-pyruvoyltetrahydropterin/6-carboxytetrahydropterin synthase
MSFELGQRFFFEAAHTLVTEVESDASRRVHGHTYHAEVTVSGTPDPLSGMAIDLGILRNLTEDIRALLDHRLLNEVEGLGPPTLENLCLFLWRHFEASLCPPHSVTISREAMGDSCRLTRVGRTGPSCT